MGSDDTEFAYGQNEREGAARSMGVDDFLAYKGNESDGGKYFSWKKDGRGNEVVWLHMRAPLLAYWHHNWPKVEEVTDRETGEKRLEVWGGRWGCHDFKFEKVLKKARYRHDDPTGMSAGEREYPPVIDPLCKMIEMVVTEVREGRLSWVEPVFKFEGSDPTRSRIMLAGGLYGAFNAKEMSPERKGEMRKAGVRKDEAFQQDIRAKCSFVMCLVNDAKPEDGAKICIEGEALKNELARAINDTRKRRRSKDDSPLVRPYPFQFEYDASQDFNKRYTVTPLDDEPSPEVLHAIREAAPPDTKELTSVGDPEKLLASIEEHALIRLDWGAAFLDVRKTSVAVPDAIAGTKPAAVLPPTTTHAGAPPPASATGGGGYAKPGQPPPFKQAPAVVVAEKLYACEHCGKASMKGTDFVCPHCGATYEEVDGAVVMTARPCLKCKTPITLSASPQKAGEVGENVICSGCATIHNEQCVERTTRPCENQACDAQVVLGIGAVCGKCGLHHELGEKDAVAAPAKSWTWQVFAGAAEPAATPRRGRRG